MTVDEARRFIDAAHGTELEAMWLTMLLMGLRPGEAAAISWDDIDFDHRTIHIWLGRKLDAAGAAVVGDTKTPGSIRSLDAPTLVLDALAEHRTRQELQRRDLGAHWSNDDNLVFTSPTGRPTDPKAVRREFQHIIAKSRIDGNWTPNLLRHSAASLMTHAGMPIEQVADQLGHRDLRMLQKHYRHQLRPTLPGGQVLGDIFQPETPHTTPDIHPGGSSR
jgi:integrase